MNEESWCSIIAQIPRASKWPGFKKFVSNAYAHKPLSYITYNKIRKIVPDCNYGNYYVCYLNNYVRNNYVGYLNGLFCGLPKIHILPFLFFLARLFVSFVVKEGLPL